MKPLSCFQVGEIAILILCKNFPEYDGADVLIVEPLQLRRYWTNRAQTMLGGPEWRYLVEAPDGQALCVPPSRLRKKPGQIFLWHASEGCYASQ